MKRLCRMVILQLLLLLAAAVSTGTAAVDFTPGASFPGRTSQTPLLTATFIQPLDRNADWSRAQWENLFDTFHVLGLRQVVIQWTLYDNKAFFDTRSFEHVPRPPLETVLQVAQARGIELYVGLAADSRYWEAVRQSAPQLEEYLNRLRWKSEKAAQEVCAIASRYRSFKGWYIPEEIDDLTWRPPNSRALLQRHIKQLSGFLKELTPSGRVMLSCFSNARMDPDSYEEFWRGLLRETSVDILLFQDGAGTGKLPSELLPLYLNAVRNATDSTGTKLQVIVELFATISDSPFKAEPAPMRRIAQQLHMAATYATYGINAFSVPDYMSSEGGAAAQKLLRDYKSYVNP